MIICLFPFCKYSVDYLTVWVPTAWKYIVSTTSILANLVLSVSFNCGEHIH